MYTARAFVETDTVQLDALLAADPFVTLVTVDAAGARAVAALMRGRAD